MNKEIELKIELQDIPFNTFREWLSKNAILVHKLAHKEYYLNKAKDSFFYINNKGFEESLKYLRIRFKEDGDFVCFKEVHNKNTDKHVYCSEIETKVEDGKKLLTLFHKLGYENKTIIDKKREKYLFEDFEIVIDDVKDLGKFVEIEVINKKYDDTEKEFHRLFDFLHNIDIKDFKEHKDGYVFMILNRHKLTQAA